LSYQRQVGANWLLQANYPGNAPGHISGATAINYAWASLPGASPPNTNNRRLTYLANPTTGQYYANIQQTDDGANAEFHGLFLSAQKRMSRGFTLPSNFNGSHCVSSWDFAGELAGVIYQNPLNRATGERGNCGFDHRLTFSNSLVAI